MPISNDPVTIQPLSDALVDRQYISQYAVETFTFHVQSSGLLADPDGEQVLVDLDGIASPPGHISQRQATRTAPGVYQVTLSSAETAAVGFYQMTWRYVLDGVDQVFYGYVEVGASSPAYDALDVGFKGIVESAYVRFADMFDSPYGGPHLQVYFQSHFGRGRMAQLLAIAVQRLNTVAQPRMTYSLDAATNPFPYAQWGGLLDQALYIECLKHLIRSYVEQPDAQGVNVARLDRRDYMSRWQGVLTNEERDFKSTMEIFKMAHMGLGRPHVLVSGGAYGSLGLSRMPGSAAQPRIWSRGY